MPLVKEHTAVLKPGDKQFNMGQKKQPILTTNNLLALPSFTFHENNRQLHTKKISGYFFLLYSFNDAGSGCNRYQ